MAKPILAIILDGVGDRPHPALGGKTPLEAAAIPNLDALAARGSCGMIDPLGPGIVPGSSTGHLALFDDDPLAPGAKVPSRGCIEALGVGVEPAEHRVAVRGNFVTLAPDGRIADRRAGRFPSDEDHADAAHLVRAMDEAAAGSARFHYDARLAYRFVIVLEDASPHVTDTDPKSEKARPLDPKPTDGTPRAKSAASRLREALTAATKVLADHPVNAARKARGAPLATGVITRGAGLVERGPTLEQRFGVKAKAVAGGNAYRGFASYVGMELVDVRGATGDLRSDFAAKAKACEHALRSADLVYLHVKAPDICGENGDATGKRDVLAKIDKQIGTLLAKEDVVIGVTGDHSTPCTRKAHSGDPVPLIIAGPDGRRDAVREYNETACATGGLGRVRGGAYLRGLLDLADRTKKVE